MSRLLIFETHPIQYRAPVYQALQELNPDAFEVIYASDFSVRGYRDGDFGERFAWDVPLLEGYKFRVLNNERGRGIDDRRGLTGRGIAGIIRETRPAAILLNSLEYEFNWVAYALAMRRRVPIWLRTETQDFAFERSAAKAAVRSVVYRIAYAGISRAFYIGELNKQHYLRHGFSDRSLTGARYCTPNRVKPLTEAEKLKLRADMRRQLGIADDAVLVAFYGKLIDKKDPGLIFEAIQLADATLRKRLAVLVVGSGVLEADLKQRAQLLLDRHGVASHFAGFVNQSRLHAYYLASDIVVLPSRRMGETWGLVVNEALQAGCAIVVSEAVGCHADFRDWERVRTIPVHDAAALAAAIVDLAKFPRSFSWADGRLENYSVESAARAIDQAIRSLDA